MIMKFADDEDYYPVRRRGEKRRLNPNRAAIEWLENDTLDLTEERSRFLMSDIGGRYAVSEDELDVLVLALVIKARGSILGTHHSRPMFECFGITWNKGMMSYSNPCPDCYNFAYSSRRCGQHNGGPIYVPESTAPTVRVDVADCNLSATMTGVDGAQVAITWRVDPS